MQPHPEVQSTAVNRSPQQERSVFFLLSALLWLLLWSGYNTGIGLVLSPGFPANSLQLVHGIRAFFPLLAAWVAVLTILSSHGLKTRAVVGPLGLLTFFAAAGLISSSLISIHPIQAVYWCAMYESVAIVLMAVCSGPGALGLLSKLMKLNWAIDIGILIGLLAAIPSFGGTALVPTQGSPLGVMAYNGSVGAYGEILGMPSTRNTGLARYAGVAAIIGLARLFQRTRGWKKALWAGVLLLGLYSLVLAQGRTETLSFLAAAMVILILRKQRRVVLIGFGILGFALLALVGFFNGLWNFGTRNGSFDPTLTGRTSQWMAGVAATLHSPWIGLGFQADRFYVGAQLENAFFHALIQSGVLGAIAYVGAYALAWLLLIRLLISRQQNLVPDEVAGILAFFTVFSVTESIAYYSAAFMLVAPVLAYIQVLAWQQKMASARTPVARWKPARLGTPAFGMQRTQAMKRSLFHGTDF